LAPTKGYNNTGTKERMGESQKNPHIKEKKWQYDGGS
jgi:hypothetical protein